MAEKNVTVKGGAGLNADLSKLDSIYRLIIVAGLRSKQLVRGSLPRIVVDPLKRRSTSIALEEVRQGLVPFTVRPVLEPAALAARNGGRGDSVLPA